MPRAAQKSSIEVHPRIRGEDPYARCLCAFVWGSPPHTRGRLVRKWGLFRYFGFTPAYAGKIEDTAARIAADEVHPRIRGEDPVAVCLYPTPPGSPPHTRGRSAPHGGKPYVVGFTPAYAGKIPRLHGYIAVAWVHPRIRGEDTGRQGRQLTLRGSPPHTRGR